MTASDLDQLDDLLQYLGHTSGEVLAVPGHPLNAVSPWQGVDKALEGDVIKNVLNQRNSEVEHGSRMTYQQHRAAARPARSEIRQIV